MKNLNALPAIIAKRYSIVRETLSKKNVKNLADKLLGAGDSAELKAISAALGIFIGIIPAWGFQTLAAIFLAVSLRLNKTFVLLFSQISFPPLIPIIIFASFRTGSIWFRQPSPCPTGVIAILTGAGFTQYIAGSFTLAVAAATATGLLVYIIFKSSLLIKQAKQKKDAIRNWFRPVLGFNNPAATAKR